MTAALRRLGAHLAATFAVLLVACLPARAACTLNAAGMSMTPGTASTGTYTYPTAAAIQAISVVITGTATTTSAGSNSCTLALSFQRSSYPPATMANGSGGSMTLPYTITSASGGGNTLLFTGTTVSYSNIVQYAFTISGVGSAKAFTAPITIYIVAQPNSPQQWGSYSDSLTAWVFDINTGYGVYSRTFGVTGTVTKVCTIGGVYHPSADTATIPVSSGSVVTTIINKSYSTVACNAPANLQLTSQSGGVVTAGTPPSGFTNIINYSASATFSSATATLNTATTATAAGPESGTAVGTSGTLPSGTMTLAITPTANAQKLLAGTYTDTLTITLTPQ